LTLQALRSELSHLRLGERGVFLRDRRGDQPEAVRGQGCLRLGKSALILALFLRREVRQGVEVENAPGEETGLLTGLIERGVRGDTSNSHIVQAVRGEGHEIDCSPFQDRGDPRLGIRGPEFAKSIASIPQANLEERHKPGEVAAGEQITMEAGRRYQPL